MRYLCVYRSVEGGPMDPEMPVKMGALIEEMTKAGVLLATEGCLPSKLGARLRRNGAKFTVTDGPFTESKELIAGFALIEVRSKDEAIEWSKRFLDVAGDGETEIRQLYAGPPPVD